MRGSVAESRSNVSNYKGEGAAKASGGYSLKPSTQGDGTSVSARRGGPQNGELRLGKLQVVVWLGLALGSVVGAYFVGFFSGRYVGFESARESSSGAVAKLPVPESFQGAANQNPGGVYEKLKAPAILREPEGEALAVKERGTAGLRGEFGAKVDEGARQVALDDGRQAILKDGVNEEGITSTGHEEEEEAEKNLEGAIAEPDSGPELIIGLEEGIQAPKVPDSVRLLGAGKAGSADVARAGAAAVAPAKVVTPPKGERSATSLLDERIANARSDSTKAAQTGDGQDLSVSRDSGPLVRKVVPSGYFAQVAAPKKLSEAESVAGKLKRSGFPVMVESASVAGQSFYRVLVGPEQNKVQADRLVSQLKSEKYLSGDPFIRKVK